MRATTERAAAQQAAYANHTRSTGSRGPHATVRTSVIVETSAGLFCEAGGFHIDPWLPADRAVITHAHSDHARPGSSAYLCAADGEGLLRRRLPDAHVEAV